jgi:hypothetical protein
MWISTRAHVLTTAFYLAAMIAMLGFLRTGKLVHAAAVVVLGFMATFSKESGVTLPAALALLAIYEKRTRPSTSARREALLLLATLQRRHSPTSCSEHAPGRTLQHEVEGHTYSLSPKFVEQPGIFVADIRDVDHRGRSAGVLTVPEWRQNSLQSADA